MEGTKLAAGDQAPWFHLPAIGGRSNFAFDTVAGRPILLLFFGSAGSAEGHAALQLVLQDRSLFDDRNASFFGITNDIQDAELRRVESQVPGLRYLLDIGNEVAAKYGLASEDRSRLLEPCWFLLDRALQVVGKYRIPEGPQAFAHFVQLTKDPDPYGWAPVLVVPQVFEPALCRALIELYHRNGGSESGFARDVGGQTRILTDFSHKRRSDWIIRDEGLEAALNQRLSRRLNPLIKKVFQFSCTRVERHLVACYDSGLNAHFKPHRDNTTLGTAHRKFAVTLNLNSDEYEGGELRFPEYGDRTYRAPPGAAIVFSCGLLHEATAVTAGVRFAFLPFLYDEEGAKLRAANSEFVDIPGPKYKYVPSKRDRAQ